MMNSRERLMAVLTGGEPDRVPWAPLIDPYFTSSLGEQGLDLNEIDAIRYIGGDVILRHVHMIGGKAGNIERRTTRRGNEELHTIETPVGSIHARYKYAGNTCYNQEHYIKTIEDLKVMQYIAEHGDPEPDYRNFIETDRLIGDNGIATASSPLTPIQALLQHNMGVEKFAYLLYDYPDEVEEYMQASHCNNLKVYKLMAEAPDPMKVFIAYEDTSTTVMGPPWYEKYCRDYINEYADILHSGGKIFITHMCGKLSGIAKYISPGRQDGIDSVCPPTTGDLWAHEAMKMMPGKIIIGGIEPPALKRMSVDETKDYVRKVLSDCAPCKGLILSTGDATSYGTPIENLKAVTEVIKEMGTYPVRTV